MVEWKITVEELESKFMSPNKTHASAAYLWWHRNRKYPVSVPILHRFPVPAQFSDELLCFLSFKQNN